MDEHVNNITIYPSEEEKIHLEVKYEDGELNEDSVIQKIRTTAADEKK